MRLALVDRSALESLFDGCVIMRKESQPLILGLISYRTCRTILMMFSQERNVFGMQEEIVFTSEERDAQSVETESNECD